MPGTRWISSVCTVVLSEMWLGAHSRVRAPLRPHRLIRGERRRRRAAGPIRGCHTRSTALGHVPLLEEHWRGLRVDRFGYRGVHLLMRVFHASIVIMSLAGATAANAATITAA